MSTINSIRPIPVLEPPVIKRLLKNIYYDTESGCLIWLGKPSEAGYGAISIDKQPYNAHRVFYSWVHGTIIPRELDHICQNRRCVAPYHLREVSHKANSQRQKLQVNSRTGFKGVTLLKNRKSKPYMARITVNRKCIYLGYYSTPEEAGAVYDAAAKIYHFDPILNGSNK